MGLERKGKRELRVPQARVLNALLRLGKGAALTRTDLAKLAGFISTSGTINRVLHGISDGSSSGVPHVGLLELGYVARIAIKGTRQMKYQITDLGIEAITRYLTTRTLPTARYKGWSINDRYQGLEPDQAEERPINIEDQEWADEVIDQAIRANRLSMGIVPTENREALARVRRGQARIRKLTVEQYGGRCAVCDVTDPVLLVASHVVGWAEAPEHRGDLTNVICLCSLHDALFEAGYWSLADDFALLKRQKVTSNTVRQLLEAMKIFRIPAEFVPSPRFIKRHRARTGFEF